MSLRDEAGGDWWTVAVFVAVVAALIVTRALARRTTTRPVRRALIAENVETRRAAVLVAAHDGLARYERVLLRVTRMEDGDDVLVVLAEAILDQPKRRRLTCRQLVRWADEFLDAHPAPPSAVARCHRGVVPRVPAAEEQRVDALVVMGAFVPEDGPRARVPASRRRWRAHPDELDPLAIVEAIAPPRGARSNGRGPTLRECAVDVEALLDRLVDVSRRPPELGPPQGARPRPGPRRAPAGRPAALATTHEDGA